MISRTAALPRLPAAAEAYDPAVYWSARLAADPGPEGTGWQGLGRAFNVWLYRARRRVLRRVTAIYGFAAAPPRVLELGPGNGFSVREWAKLGVRELVGVEIAPAAVTRLRRRFPEYRFVQGDVGEGLGAAFTPGESALSPDPSPGFGRGEPKATGSGLGSPLPDSGEGLGALSPRASADGDPEHGFDVVTAFDLLFHLTDDAAWERAVAGMAAAVRPGGLVLISDLFPHEEMVRLAHQVSRTAARYEERLTAHGLRVVARWPVFVLLHPWVDVRSPTVRRVGRLWWSAIERLAGHVPGAGGPLGALLYAADGMLTRLLGEGPSTELWVLRREG